MTDFVILCILVIVIFLLRPWVPSPPPKPSLEPGGDPVSPPECSSCSLLQNKLETEQLALTHQGWRLDHAERENNNLRTILERKRETRQALQLALTRVREHHLPGWHMNESGMCPLCQNTKIFDLAQALLGQMDFNVPPPQQEKGQTQ